VTLFDCLGCLAALQGAVAGALGGWWKYGWLGAVIGLPVGAVAGLIALTALWVGCIVIVLPIAILWTDGPRGLWDFVRGRWVPPVDRPQPPPAPPTDTNSSAG
jgi:hypothetical protein